jgi:hypothetical protein
LERTIDCRVGVFPDNAVLSRQANAASGLGMFRDAARIFDGDIQYLAVMERFKY